VPNRPSTIIEFWLVDWFPETRIRSKKAPIWAKCLHRATDSDFRPTPATPINIGFLPTPPNLFAMIKISQLHFRYPGSQFELLIDQLEFPAGEKTAVLGPSGCGKTTLLNLISGIEKPLTGEINVRGEAVEKMNDARRRDFRVQKVGMVFQEFELVEYLNALENILLPFAINRSFKNRKNAAQRARTLAESAGIADKLNRIPRQLSRGEQQRVAICRALVAAPKIILADEPTGNLDPATKEIILNLLFEICEEQALTLVVVTHDHSLLPRFDHVVDFEKLRFSTSEKVEAP